MLLRPPLPNRFEQVFSTDAPAKGLQKAEISEVACGSAKQFRLRKLSPPWTGFQPRTLSGKLKASVLFIPSGSGAMVAVKGTPVLALKILPSSQPLATQPSTLGTSLGLGISQL